MNIQDCLRERSSKLLADAKIELEIALGGVQIGGYYYCILVRRKILGRLQSEVLVGLLNQDSFDS